MQLSQYLRSTRLSTTSHSSTVGTQNSFLNGLIPSLTPNHSPNQKRVLNNCNNQLKRSEKLKYILLIVCLTIIFACLFILTIELATIFVKQKNEDNLTLINNQTKFEEKKINSFFACVWFFNLLLFIICLFVHGFIYKRRSQHNRARAAFLR